MQSSEGIPILEGVLKDAGEHPMVRHEAAEALGAIGSEQCLEILQRYKADQEEVVRETVELALGRITEVKGSKLSGDQKSPYLSVDPAFPMDCKDVKKLEEVLLDEGVPLYQRYQAMFSLRDLNTKESIEALCKGFQGKSALFRHEIAFVLGQIQSPESIQALAGNLRDLKENEMVRHECAEALGAIGNPECEKILKEYLEDDRRVVRESCVVALDICDYEMTGNFQYADGLQTIAN
jgi:deoxyhypusine monooxygenase